jgi:electron transport complex protein RnfG
MSGSGKDFIKPVVVLTAICIATSAALALTQAAAGPVIEATQKSAQEAARVEVLPAADGFEDAMVTGMPEGVSEAYKAQNGAGYVFIASGKGYGGEMRLIVGIDADGKITGTKTLAHAETAGLGAKTAEPKFQSQFIGKDASLSGVDTISGATISSKAFIGIVNEAMQAYQLLAKGA